MYTLKISPMVYDDWDDTDREAFISYIAANCEAGDEIPETGGLRKLRWTRQGIGKRGGVRVIYYYYNEKAPLFLLTAYSKSAQENLTAEEKTVFRKMVAELKKSFKTQKGGQLND
jgi:hypothetical protein